VAPWADFYRPMRYTVPLARHHRRVPPGSTEPTGWLLDAVRHLSRAGADAHVLQEASSPTARGRSAPSLVPRLRRCQLFARGSPSSVCPTSGRCSADGERQSKQGSRKTERKSRELIARQTLAQTLSRMPGAIAHPRIDVRLRLPVQRNEVASRNADLTAGRARSAGTRECILLRGARGQLAPAV